MSNKRILADQVLYFLAGGYPDVASSVMREDVYKRIEQVVNNTFGMQQFAMNLPSGETIPNNLALATYQDVPIVKYVVGRSMAVLPVMPITLPRNAGIQEIRPVMPPYTSDRIVGAPMIPLQHGQGYLLQADDLLNDLMGQYSYEPSGINVLFSKNLLALQILKVDMKLVVLDISQYGETDVLPVPSDLEDTIINKVVQFFIPVHGQPNIVSNITAAQ